MTRKRSVAARIARTLGARVVAVSDRLRKTAEANDFWPAMLDAEAGYA